MGQTKLHVELLDFTKDAMALLYTAYRQCYSENFAANIFADALKNQTKIEGFIKQILASRHESPLEHIKFTFAIEGVSRALTHQLVRHRVASYSQQSQRYVKETNFDYIIPPSIEQYPEMKKEYVTIMQEIQSSYNRLLKTLEKKGIKGETAYQDARFILPQATETKIIVTMNCRELLHFFNERCCSRAQWEIRMFAEEMLKICKEKLPLIFDNAGPKCVNLGYCPEGPKFSCRRYPLKEDILKANKNH